MERDLVQLSKSISHALRHQPQVYGLTLDADGWVEVVDLLAALRGQRPDVSEELLRQIMAASDKQRFEMVDGRIRAFYGHSVPTKIDKEEKEPPMLLYHGTSEAVVEVILAEGLKPMKRQYVHLSADTAMALQVGRRRAGRTIILKVRAGEAYRQGLKFYLGNDAVWLADEVPPQYIETLE